jgi:hypothetical protein
MAAEQINALVFKTEQLRSELDQLYHDFPALNTKSASASGIPSNNRMQPMLISMKHISAGLETARYIFDTLVPKQQAYIVELEKTLNGFNEEMKKIHFVIWNADPERAKADKRAVEAKREAIMKAEENSTVVSRDLPSAPIPKVKDDDHPILIRPFLVWAISNACSPSSQEACLRIMKLDPMMVTWHLMGASFRASPGDLQIVCMTPATLSLMPARWGGCISTNVSTQKGVTRSAAHVPDFSPAEAEGMTVLAWRWFERGHHEWKDAEGYNIPRLAELVQEWLDRV